VVCGMPQFKIVVSDPEAKDERYYLVRVVGDESIKYGVEEKEEKKLPIAKVNPELLKRLNTPYKLITVRIWKSKEKREKVNMSFRAVEDLNIPPEEIRVSKDILSEKLGVDKVLGEVFRTKTFQIVVEGEKAQRLIGLKIGDVFDASIVGIPGKLLLITGGSDSSGFPMRPDLPGGVKKPLLLSDPPGFHPREKGERRRKMVRGNTIVEDIAQVNTKIVSPEEVRK